MEAASSLMPASDPKDMLTESGSSTPTSSRAPRIAESGRAPSESRATFRAMSCAFGAVPRIVPPLPVAMPDTWVPCERSALEWGTTSASLSA